MSVSDVSSESQAIGAIYQSSWTSLTRLAFLRRPRRWIAVTVAAAALMVVVGLVVANRSPSQQPFDSPDPPGSVTTYDLALESALLVDDRTGSARGTDVSLWTHDDGTYLSLVVRGGPTFPSGFDVTEIADFPTERGRAWYGEAPIQTGNGNATSSTLWWHRSTGDVWLLRADWYGDAPAADYQPQLLSWAFDITTPEPSTYLLDAAGIRAVAAERAGDSRDRARTWDYYGEQILIHVIEDASAAGLSNIIGRGRPTQIEIASRQGWIVEAAETTTVGWEIDDISHDWATLQIPGTLADQADEIIRSVVPATE